MIRFRTLGDITITGGQESEADTLEKLFRRWHPHDKLNAVIEKMTKGAKVPWRTANEVISNQLDF